MYFLMAGVFKDTITYLVKYFGDWALCGTEALAANLEKRNWPLEEGAGGGGGTVAATSASASAPCTS